MPSSKRHRLPVFRMPIRLIVLIGLTWGFFQHLLSGIRHLVMDTGAAL